MNTFQKQVKEWMIKAKQSCPSKITIPDENTIKLRLKLLQEELDEIKDNPTDIVNVADGLADLLYVAYGMAISYGLDMQPIWDEVHSSNMTKFIDGHEREDGKWIKGPSYTPANIKLVIEKMKSAEIEDKQLELNLQ